MREQENTAEEAAIELRKNAEEKLLNQNLEKCIDEADNLMLFHELQVHQIELEMQNEELILAKEKAESNNEKYVDLYDFAPCGYLSLSEDATIIDLNFSASHILGKDRSRLKNTRFGLHVSGESLESFNLLLTNASLFNKKIKL